jgi:hypothetical protein
MQQAVRDGLIALVAATGEVMAAPTLAGGRASDQIKKEN